MVPTRSRSAGTRRAWLAGPVGLAGAGGALMTACGAPGAQDPAGAPRASTGPVTLVLNTDWVGPSPRGQVTEKGLAEFAQRFPQIKVNVEPLPENTVDKLTSLIASDSIGDVTLWTHHLVVYFARRGFFTDVRPYLKTFKFSLEDVYSIKEIVEYEGKLIAVPFQLNLFDWVYNKTLFRQAGVAPPGDAWTWDDLLAAAKKLTDPDKGQWGLKWQVDHPHWMTPIWANGGSLLNQAFTRTTLGEPPAAEALQLILDVVHKHRVAPLPSEHRARQVDFPKGNYAMAIANSPGRALDKALADLGQMEWDFLYAPTLPRGAKRTVQANLQPYVLPATKRATVEQAAQLAFFMGGEHVQGLIADLGAATPTFKKVIDSDRYLVPDHRRKVVLDGHAYRRGMGSAFEAYVPWRAAVEAELIKGWEGQASPRATADSATAAGDAALATAGVKVG